MAENFPDAQTEYRSFQLAVSFRRDGGRVVMPVAGLNPDGTPLPPKVIQLHSPYGVKVVSFSVEAYGRVPTVPSPVSADPNDTLLEDEVSYPVPMTDPGTGRHYWKIDGRYVFSLARPVDPTKGLPGLALPNELGGKGPTSNDIPGGAFSQNLIGNAGK